MQATPGKQAPSWQPIRRHPFRFPSPVMPGERGRKKVLDNANVFVNNEDGDEGDDKGNDEGNDEGYD